MGDRIAVFSQGKLQQVADPKTLYRKPVNAFVAGFIGSPPMNLLPGALVEGAAVNLLPDALVKDAGRSVSMAEVLVGLRAEDLRVSAAGARDLRVSAAGAGDEASLGGTVALVEYLGAESIVHVTVDGQRVLARAGEGDWSRGDTVALSFDPACVHLFDAAQGHRLEPAEPAS